MFQISKPDLTAAVKTHKSRLLTAKSLGISTYNLDRWMETHGLTYPYCQNEKTIILDAYNAAEDKLDFLFDLVFNTILADVNKFFTVNPRTLHPQNPVKTTMTILAANFNREICTEELREVVSKICEKEISQNYFRVILCRVRQNLRPHYRLKTKKGMVTFTQAFTNKVE